MPSATRFVMALSAALAPALFPAATVAQDAGASSVRAPDNNPPSGWARPMVLIAPSPPAADGSDLVWSWVAGAGIVEATRRTTSGIGASLPAAASAANKAVEACRRAAWGDAAQLGARHIEAAPAGQAKKDRWGRISAPVHMRITYSRLLLWEIREGVMTCTIDKNGRVVSATM